MMWMVVFCWFVSKLDCWLINGIQELKRLGHRIMFTPSVDQEGIKSYRSSHSLCGVSKVYIYVTSIASHHKRRDLSLYIRDFPNLYSLLEIISCSCLWEGPTLVIGQPFSWFGCPLGLWVTVDIFVSSRSCVFVSSGLSGWWNTSDLPGPWDFVDTGSPYVTNYVLWLLVCTNLGNKIHGFSYSSWYCRCIEDYFSTIPFSQWLLHATHIIPR